VRILILNQYAPPDPAPTARLVGELSTALQGAGHEVQIAHSAQKYRGKRPSPFWRALREVSALIKLLSNGLRLPRPDVIISTSSPPGLLVIATLLARLRRCRSAHWALDLYPELAFRLGPKVPWFLQSIAYRLVGLCYRSADRLVTLDQDMQSHLRELYGVGSELIRPWVLQRDLPPDAAYPVKETFRWIYSGNLGLAHDWKTLVNAQGLLESRGLPIRLVFQGGGAYWPAAFEFASAQGLKQIDWLDYVADQELVPSLLACHALVVTQNPLTRGLLWPSKLGLIVRLPRPIVFVGPTNGAIASELRNRPGTGVFEPGESERLASYVTTLYENWPPKIPPLVDRKDDRRAAFEAWASVVDRFARTD
jgi:colanic acid biosynthesis glycosyl transferase WcaI